MFIFYLERLNQSFVYSTIKNCFFFSLTILLKWKNQKSKLINLKKGLITHKIVLYHPLNKI